jgi:hypothetical protein
MIVRNEKTFNNIIGFKFPMSKKEKENNFFNDIPVSYIEEIEMNYRQKRQLTSNGFYQKSLTIFYTCFQTMILLSILTEMEIKILSELKEITVVDVYLNLRNHYARFDFLEKSQNLLEELIENKVITSTILSTLITEFYEKSIDNSKSYVLINTKLF